MSREYTTEEARQQFIDQIRTYIDYWDKVKLDHDDTVWYRLSGLAHSILVILDGGTDLPAFAVIPNPHPDDKEYYKDNDENYYSECSEEELKNSISGGGLHDLLFYNWIKEN